MESRWNLRGTCARRVHARKPLLYNSLRLFCGTWRHIFKNHFSVALLQLAEYPAQAGGLAVVQPVAVVAGVAVGACGVAAELADGQLLPAAAADEAGRLPQGHVTVSHVQ